MNFFRLRVEGCKTTINVIDSINPPAVAQSPKTVVLRTLFGVRMRVLTPIHYDWSWDASTGATQSVDSNNVINEDEPSLIRNWSFPDISVYANRFRNIMPEWRNGLNYVVAPTPVSPNTWIRSGSKYILNSNFSSIGDIGSWKKIDETPRVGGGSLVEAKSSVLPYGNFMSFGEEDEKNYYARLEESNTVVMIPTVFGTYEYDKDIVTTIRLSSPPTIGIIDSKRSLYALSGEYTTGKLRVKIESIFDN